MIHYGTLLQKLQNASGFLFQNATVLLQNATVITYCDDFTTKCNSYYKMQRLLQIETVQLATSQVPVTMFLHKCKRH